MRKVSLWRRLGTRVQLMIVCVLFFALGFMIVAAWHTQAGSSRSSGEFSFAFVDPTPTPIPTPAPEIMIPDWDDFFFAEIDSRPFSFFTGLREYEENITRRPIAVVINNAFGAHPQSGIAEADIIYEVLAEGRTTRLVAIFQSSIPDKIGPVRSARDHFVDFAFNHDAFFVHHGGSPSGYYRIRRLLGTNAIDGMRFEGTVFWRDRSFPYWMETDARRSVEHSSYTGKEHLLEHIYSRGIRERFEGDEAYWPGFGLRFGNVPSWLEPMQTDVSRVVIPFANTIYTAFTLDSSTGLYEVSHARGPWIDENTRTQVNVANILVQHTAIHVVDNEGRRDVRTIGSGTGYLVRDGNVFSARWEKSSHTSPMRWFFEDGTPLVFAPGRTWINVLQTSAQPEFLTGIGEPYGV